MCDCLNNVVEIAVCVEAGAIADDDAPTELGTIARWARHDRAVDLSTARSAPVHYAIALLNVPRGGRTAHWLLTQLESILDVADSSGLHPAWRAYGGLWLAHMAVAVGAGAPDPASSEQALRSARRHVDAVGGVCPDALLAPPTVAELEHLPYAWLQCEETRRTVPGASELRREVAAAPVDVSPVDVLSPLVLGLRTVTSDDWRTWPSAQLVRRLHRG